MFDLRHPRMPEPVTLAVPDIAASLAACTADGEHPPTAPAAGAQM